MNYIQVDIYTTTVGIDPVGAMLLEIGVGGFAVQDAADFADFLQNKPIKWDYIDDDLMQLLESETTLSAYLPETTQGADMLSKIEDGLVRLQSLDIANEWGRLIFQLHTVKEEDWAEAWKQYYRPVKVGDRLVVCPSWENYTPIDNEVVLEIDPGMAFGTGTHASTRLCMQLLEQFCQPESLVLDVGCGSGILAVSALLLGAKRAVGVDLDAVAVRVAQENADRNNVADSATFFAGNLADKVTGQFDLVCANIVADVIIGFSADVTKHLLKDGVFICSGIIDTREQDVIPALESAGLKVVQRLTEGGWVAMACKITG